MPRDEHRQVGDDADADGLDWTDGRGRHAPVRRGLTVANTGFSQPRLRRFHDVLAGHVEGGELPGLVALMARGDEVHVEVLGARSVGDPAPMRRDTIFRIASITKPITAGRAVSAGRAAPARPPTSTPPTT